MKRIVVEWPKKNCVISGKSNSELLREEMLAYAKRKGKGVRSARQFCVLSVWKSLTEVLLPIWQNNYPNDALFLQQTFILRFSWL